MKGVMVTGDEEQAISPEMLARDTRRTQASSRHLKARVTELAEALARTEESVAATMDRLASSHPGRAERLNAMSESARKQAVQARAMAERALTGGGRTGTMPPPQP